MMFVRKKLLSAGNYSVRVSSVNVINEGSPTERILINVSHPEGAVPVISYSVAGYDMLNQILDKYACDELKDLVGKDVEISVYERDGYLNARFGSSKDSDEPTL
jgi:hypothetical protein